MAGRKKASPDSSTLVRSWPTVGLRIEPKDLEAIDRFAADTSRGRQDAIRLAIKELIKKHGDK